MYANTQVTLTKNLCRSFQFWYRWPFLCFTLCKRKKKKPKKRSSVSKVKEKCRFGNHLWLCLAQVLLTKWPLFGVELFDFHVHVKCCTVFSMLVLFFSFGCWSVFAWDILVEYYSSCPHECLHEICLLHIFTLTNIAFKRCTFVFIIVLYWWLVRANLRVFKNSLTYCSGWYVSNLHLPLAINKKEEEENVCKM